jgi:hypothetical protein
MPFVIQRTDGAYVARAGSNSSYTRLLQNAQLYSSEKLADLNRCPENERVLPLAEAFQH